MYMSPPVALQPPPPSHPAGSSIDGARFDLRCVPSLTLPPPDFKVNPTLSIKNQRRRRNPKKSRLPCTRSFYNKFLRLIKSLCRILFQLWAAIRWSYLSSFFRKKSQNILTEVTFSLKIFHHFSRDGSCGVFSNIKFPCWWLVRVTSVVALAFDPTFWELVRTYEWYFAILWMQVKCREYHEVVLWSFCTHSKHAETTLGMSTHAIIHSRATWWNFHYLVS